MTECSICRQEEGTEHFTALVARPTKYLVTEETNEVLHLCKHCRYTLLRRLLREMEAADVAELIDIMKTEWQ